MAAAARGPSWLLRARLCQRRTRRSLAPEPACAVRRLFIGRSETDADWPIPEGRLPALSGSALARLQAFASWPEAQSRVSTLTASRAAWEMAHPQQPGPRGSGTPGAPAARARSASASLQFQPPGLEPSSQFTDAETEAKYQLHQCPATMAA